MAPYLVPTKAALAVLALLATSSVASPVALDEGFTTIAISKRLVGTTMAPGGKADLTWLKAQEARTIAKYDATLTAFEKNNGQTIKGFSSIADRKLLQGFASTAGQSKRQSESLTDEQGGSYWQGSLTVGTPPVSFVMDFDTGSADLWVPSTACGACTGTKYNTTASSTAKNQSRTFQISYGDGSSTSGQVFTDTVTVAGLTATGQGVGAASTVSSTTGATFDGLVGMAYQAISAENEPPLFATLLSEGKVKSGQFSFRLAASGSELYLGGKDSSKYTGQITYAPVTTKAYWQVTMGSVKANGVVAVSSRGAVIDTGTTVIYGPSSDVSAFYAKYPGATALSNFGYSASTYAGYYAVPCSGSTNYASLTFNSRSFSIPTSIFTSLGSVGTMNGVQYCVGGIIGNDNLGLGTSWLVGDVFLQAVYSVFDLTNNQVGFATPV